MKKSFKKKHSPSILLEFINDRFKTNIGYKEILNYISKKNKSLFGNSSEEFSNFINLLNEMKNSGLEYICNFNQDPKTLETKNLFFSTSDSYHKYNYVVICDTTFGVNRYVYSVTQIIN